MKAFKVAGKSIRKFLELKYTSAMGYLIYLLLAALVIDGVLFYYSEGFQMGMLVNDDVYLSQVYPGQKMTAEVHCARSGAASGASGVGLLLYELGCRLTVK